MREAAGLIQDPLMGRPSADSLAGHNRRLDLLSDAIEAVAERLVALCSTV